MIIRLCIFTISFAYNRQNLINYLEKIIPPEVELFLFVPKECKSKYYSKRIRIYESNLNKYNCFIDFRKFCRKNKIQRIFSMGALPQEAYLMTLASVFSKTDFIPHLVVNPFTAYKIGFTKYSIKAFLELLAFYPILPFTKRLYSNARDTTVMSLKYFFPFKKKISFLKMPINTDLFKPKNKRTIRKRLKLPLNKKIAITVGRIEYLKGSDIIFKLAKLNPDVLFILIGILNDKNIEKTKLKNIKVIQDISSKQVASLSDYYVASDLCLFPSRTEGFPLAPREAMSCEIPALVPNTPNLAEIKKAIKIPFSLGNMNKGLNNFFNLSKNKNKEISKESREYILQDCSDSVCKKIYIEKLLN